MFPSGNDITPVRSTCFTPATSLNVERGTAATGIENVSAANSRVLEMKAKGATTALGLPSKDVRHSALVAMADTFVSIAYTNESDAILGIAAEQQVRPSPTRDQATLVS